VRFIAPLSLTLFAIGSLAATPAAAQAPKTPAKPAAKAPAGAAPATTPARKHLDQAAVRAVMTANTAAIKTCAAKSPGLRGRVVLKLTIAPAGTVETAELSQSTIKAAEVERCVLDAVRSWRFPPAAKQTKISSPIEIAGPPKKAIAPVVDLRDKSPKGKVPTATKETPGAPGPDPIAGAKAVEEDVAMSDTQGPLPRDLSASVELARRGDFTLFIGGLLQMQGAFYAGDEVAREFGDPLDRAGFRIRRARLTFSGRLVKDFSYYMALDLKDAIGVAANGPGGDPGNEILDARILWDRIPWLNISVGVDRVPFSTFALQSSARQSLIERPLTVNMAEMVPQRRVGLTVLGSMGHVSWAAGVYNGSEGITTGNQFAGLGMAARVSASLFDHPRTFVPDKLQLTAAAAFMYDDQAAVDLLRAAGSLELSGFRTRLTGEFLWVRSTPDEQPSGTPDAGEVTRWAAIGELSVFVWREYVQLSARYEYFRDNTELPTFGKQQLIGGGVNIYFYKHRMKLQINYLRRDELEGPEVENDIGFAQLQAMF
jgi:TonB family protein